MTCCDARWAEQHIHSLLTSLVHLMWLLVNHHANYTRYMLSRCVYSVYSVYRICVSGAGMLGSMLLRQVPTEEAPAGAADFKDNCSGALSCTNVYPLSHPRTHLPRLSCNRLGATWTFKRCMCVCCVADALSRCLQLVVQYPFNSLLHHLVTDIITTALAAGPASLLDHLFQHCNLLHWLLTIPVSVTPKPRPGSEG